MHVSYLEIYNEIGYDLLDPDREVLALEDLLDRAQGDYVPLVVREHDAPEGSEFLRAS